MSSAENVQELTQRLAIEADAFYKASALAYHNKQHIIDMFTAYSTLYGEIANNEEFLAIWYHDIIYVPGSGEGVCESLSAATLERIYFKHDPHRELGINLNTACYMIQNTSVANHLNNTKVVLRNGGARVMDCDLAKLGAPYPDFYDAQLRITREHSHRASPTACIAAQVKFLEQFLHKKRIYHTEEAYVDLEDRARNNIARFAREML